jgi:hypothetical protein
MGAARSVSLGGAAVMSNRAIAVVGSPQAESTLGLAASIAVESARADGESCLLVDLVADEAISRPSTLLTSAEARSLEARMRDAGLESASRGHICLISLTQSDWDQIGALELTEAAMPSRIVMSLGSRQPHERIVDWQGAVQGCVALLDLPAERSLGALVVAEMSARGIPVKLCGRPPGLIAARRALAGVPPGGHAEEYGRRVVSHFDRRGRRSDGKC